MFSKSSINRAENKFTLGSIPNLYVTVATAGHEFVRSAVVVHTKDVACMAFQNFRGQPLSPNLLDRRPRE